MKKIIAFAFLALIISGCNVELPIVSGQVCGTLTNGFSKEPAQDILIYLLDRSLEGESQESENQEAKLDSILTDQNGYYCFESLAEGSYSVVPFVSGMEIKHVDSTDSYNFEVVGDESFKVDFEITPLVTFSSFSTLVTFLNVPENENIQYLDCSVNRRCWILWMVDFEMVDQQNVYPNILGDYQFAFYQQYGVSLGFYTLDNVFHVSAMKTDVNGEYLGHYFFILYTPITDTPEEVEWEFDCSTEVLTRIK